MRHILILGLFVLASSSLAAHAQATPEAATRQWLDGFNAGDMAKVNALNSPSGTSIIDEFAPFTWTGPKAFSDWGAGFEADSKARGVTEPKVILGAPVVKNVTATDAYLIYHAIYSYKLKGVPKREPGQDAIVLHKNPDGWKVVSWAWIATVSKPSVK